MDKSRIDAESITGCWIRLTKPLPLESEREYDEDGEVISETDSFEKRGLYNIGTVVKLADGRVELIGDVNGSKGCCDCCAGFSENDLVVAYYQIDMDAILEGTV